MTSELSEFLAALLEQYTDIVRDGGDVVGAVAGVLLPMGYTVVSNRRYVDLVPIAARRPPFGTEE